jgi:hypothetical protein
LGIAESVGVAALAFTNVGEVEVREGIVGHRAEAGEDVVLGFVIEEAFAFFDVSASEVEVSGGVKGVESDGVLGSGDGFVVAAKAVVGDGEVVVGWGDGVADGDGFEEGFCGFLVTALVVEGDAEVVVGVVVVGVVLDGEAEVFFSEEVLLLIEVVHAEVVVGHP